MCFQYFKNMNECEYIYSVTVGFKGRGGATGRINLIFFYFSTAPAFNLQL